MENNGLKLYELADSFNKLEEIIEQEDDNSLIEYLDSVNIQISDKIDNVVRYRRTMELTADAIDNEIMRLEALKLSYNKKSDSLRNYISFCLKRLGKEKFDTSVAKLSFRKSSSLIIDDEKKIPNEFISEVIVKKVDKNALKQAINKGTPIEGVHIEEKSNLIIK